MQHNLIAFQRCKLQLQSCCSNRTEFLHCNFSLEREKKPTEIQVFELTKFQALFFGMQLLHLLSGYAGLYLLGLFMSPPLIIRSCPYSCTEKQSKLQTKETLIACKTKMEQQNNMTLLPNYFCLLKPTYFWKAASVNIHAHGTGASGEATCTTANLNCHD